MTNIQQQCKRWRATVHKNWREFFVTVSQGQGHTIKAPNSGVSFQIPDGVHAVFSARVHTDHSRFMSVVPDNECIAGPMVEIHHHLLKESHEEHRYIIKIPHCAPDKSYWHYIRVRSGDIYGDNVFSDIEPFDRIKRQDRWYEIDQHYITIHTTHFTNFICNLCKNVCCPNLATVFLFGSVTPSEEKTIVKLQPFVCSFLYVIEDYMLVYI